MKKSNIKDNVVTDWSHQKQNKVKLFKERCVQTKNKTTSKASPITQLFTPTAKRKDKQLNIADIQTKTIASHLMQQYRYWDIISSRISEEI